MLLIMTDRLPAALQDPDVGTPGAAREERFSRRSAVTEALRDQAAILATVRVLVVEDDARLRDLLSRALTRQGYTVEVATTGGQALGLAEVNPYDAILLDVMIPPPDGFAVLTALREADHPTPVIMLTALDAIEDRVAGLDWGADDYLTKPFELAELFARLRAVIRRGAAPRRPRLRCGGLELDPARRTVARGTLPILLSATEFSLLHEFMRHPGEVLSRTHLLEHVWDPAVERNSNIVDVYVSYLRDKIDRPWNTHSIETVRGSGYRLRDDAETAPPSG